jgi:methylated-DNA-[protein]-cysteine S-methyltransferase
MTYFTTFPSPIGTVLLIKEDGILTGLYFDTYKNKPEIQPTWIEDTNHFATVKKELSEYFNSERKTFSVPISQRGTPFQESVWKEVEKIPYGKKATYKTIAEAVGKPKASRAVGTAIGSNPVCIIGPCHRVVPTSGGLGGYAGGIEAKTFLLNLES